MSAPGVILAALTAVLQDDHLPVAGNLLNLLRGRPWSYPSMQMNGDSLERLLALLARRGYARSTIVYKLAPQAFLPDSAFIVAKLPNV